MQIEQRHVTTVNLNDGRVRDFVLLKDGRGYKLTSISKDDAVNLLLSPHDLHKLRQELARMEAKEVRAEPAAPVVPPRKEPSADETAGPYVFQWSTLDWLSFN
jgi:hypothetical protein